MSDAAPREFLTLSEAEILALAIGAEEEDMRIYASYAAALRPEFPDTAAVFDGMAAEEDEHRARLIGLYRSRFGEVIPLVRRSDVRGFYTRKPYWLVRPLGIDRVRREAAAMEQAAADFYERAAARTGDAATRQMLGDLAAAERGHESTAARLTEEHVTADAATRETDSERRRFLLQFVQPGLAGLMDGSVSTLAPVFAAAFATRDTNSTLLVGLAAALGAGISMGFTEAVSDDGTITGRGSPLIRGVVCGLMTAAGGLGHALPYLIPDFWTATVLAIIVVVLELAVISWIRWRYMESSFLGAAVQVGFGGLLVFLTGILIGST